MMTGAQKNISRKAEGSPPRAPFSAPGLGCGEPRRQLRERFRAGGSCPARGANGGKAPESLVLPQDTTTDIPELPKATQGGTPKRSYLFHVAQNRFHPM